MTLNLNLVWEPRGPETSGGIAGHGEHPQLKGAGASSPNEPLSSVVRLQFGRVVEAAMQRCVARGARVHRGSPEPRPVEALNRRNEAEPSWHIQAARLRVSQVFNI